MGAAEGCSVGLEEGTILLGLNEGYSDGTFEGRMVGNSDGLAVAGHSLTLV